MSNSSFLIRILRSKWLQASYRTEFGPSSYLVSDSSKQLSSNTAVRTMMILIGSANNLELSTERCHLNIAKRLTFEIPRINPFCADAKPID
jgi:hypothetical protein